MVPRNEFIVIGEQKIIQTKTIYPQEMRNHIKAVLLKLLWCKQLTGVKKKPLTSCWNFMCLCNWIINHVMTSDLAEKWKLCEYKSVVSKCSNWRRLKCKNILDHNLWLNGFFSKVLKQSFSVWKWFGIVGYALIKTVSFYCFIYRYLYEQIKSRNRFIVVVKNWLGHWSFWQWIVSVVH